MLQLFALGIVDIQTFDFMDKPSQEVNSVSTYVLLWSKRVIKMNEHGIAANHIVIKIFWSLS